MVTVLKIGRRKHKNVLASVADEMKGFFTLQSNMWIMCNDAVRRLKKRADLDLRLGDDTLKVTVSYPPSSVDIADDANYEMKWIVVEMSALTYAREYEAYQGILKFNDALKKNYEQMKEKNGIVINKPKSKVFDAAKNQFKLTRDAIEDAIAKGLDKEKNKNVSDYLLDLEIYIVTIPPSEESFSK